MAPHVKIVLPCANEGEWVRATVDSLLETTDYPSYEIVISANGDETTDFTFIAAPARKDRVRLLRTAEFLGVGKSLEVAVKPGDADYYFFLDAHCLVERADWLDRLVTLEQRRPETSMIQPEVLVFTHRGELAPGMPLDRSRLRYHFFDYSIRWAWPYDDPWHLADDLREKLSEEPFEWMAASGMAMFVRAETFHGLGGFDSEVNGWYREGLDYCVRGWLMGRPMLVDPTVRVLHRMKLEASTYPRCAVHMIHGVLRTTHKYFSPRRCELARLLFRRHGLDAEVDQALVWLKQGRWIEERARHLAERVHDDDWLFDRFDIFEDRFTGKEFAPPRLFLPENILQRDGRPLRDPRFAADPPE